ncbi:MAG: pyruvate kinase [Anaerolineae bacterium]|nr:pyruvate kinase [Anaerolineae bacterium]
MSLTKIVCTLGPACESPAVLREMVRAGMTVARLNFSHGTPDEKRTTAALVRQVAAEMGCQVALMGDLQGPKIRVGVLPAEGVQLIAGQEVFLTAGEADLTTVYRIPFPHPDIVDDIRRGDRILLDDGALELEVIAVAPPEVRCRVCVGGRLTSHKGVNLPGVQLQIPAMTSKDRDDALLALELGLDYLALSFVRKAADVTVLRDFLFEQAKVSPVREEGKSPHQTPGIVAKIEKPEALDDLEAIVRVADAVMVARGDLGVETAPEQVPVVQKRIIHLCNRLSKPVITATQMLQSMIEAPRPTRAEASDVANAILDGSDAVMLSGETSVGKYPVEAVRMMSRIAETVEASAEFPYDQLLNVEERDLPDHVIISRAISRATVSIAQATQATAILTSTDSGRTARMVARHRPRVPLLAITSFEETARRMQLVWGVLPSVAVPFDTTDEMIEILVKAAAAHGYAKVGNNVVLTAGIPFVVHGVTNMLKVHTVREEDLN